jgi:hypothetical protein
MAKSKKTGKKPEEPSRQAMRTEMQMPASYAETRFNRKSFAMGFAAGAIILALLLSGYFALQPAPAAEKAPPGQPVPAPAGKATESKTHNGTGLQISIANYGKQAVVIIGAAENISSIANLTGVVNPGEVKTASVATAAGCGAGFSQCKTQINLEYVAGAGGKDGWQGGSGNATSGEGQGSSGETSGGPASAGNGAAATHEPLAISTQYLAVAVQDAKYSFAMEASGGAGIYRWSAFGLPSGLSISERGLISGAALAKGAFVVRFLVDDGSSTAYVEKQLTVE